MNFTVRLSLSETWTHREETAQIKPQITADINHHGMQTDESQSLNVHYCKTPEINNVIKRHNIPLQWEKQRPRKSYQFAVIAATSTATKLIGVFLAVSRSKNFQASSGFHISRDAVFSGRFDPRWRAVSVPQLAGIHEETRFQLPRRTRSQAKC